MPKNAPALKSNGKRRHNQASSNDQSMACADMEEEKERSYEKTQSDKGKQPQEKAGPAKLSKREAKAEEKTLAKQELNKQSLTYRQQYQNTQQF